VEYSGKEADGGGLAGAAGSNVAKDAAPGDAQIDIANGVLLAEPLTEAFGLDRRLLEQTPSFMAMVDFEPTLNVPLEWPKHALLKKR
jgi:hypothetical protein